MRYLLVVLLGCLTLPTIAQDGPPKIGMAESPGIKVLTGLTVPEFEQEMQMMVQALGVNCGFCHLRNNYASEANDHKITARRMLEMTKLINQQFFPNYIVREGDSKLGKVTCTTCHQGSEKPKSGN